LLLSAESIFGVTDQRRTIQFHWRGA
jgi:hypothetical protein